MFVPFSLGRYTVVDRIRYGGMGEVLAAQRVDEEGAISTWAVKRPLPTVVEDPELLSLFWKETELMQRMEHPSFPKVEEVGVSQGIPFMVMELIRGVSVVEIIAAEKTDVIELLRPETWVLMVSDLATAVGELHRYKRGDQVLIHGDIKAANIMIDTVGKVRLLDLGLALANDQLWRRIVRGGRRDLPPFLESNQKSREVDTFAIGTLLIECLGGKSHVFSENCRLPPNLVEVLRKATDRSGLYVFKSARSLNWELKSYLQQDRIEQMRTELGKAIKSIREHNSNISDDSEGH